MYGCTLLTGCCLAGCSNHYPPWGFCVQMVVRLLGFNWKHGSLHSDSIMYDFSITNLFIFISSYCTVQLCYSLCFLCISITLASFVDALSYDWEQDSSGCEPRCGIRSSVIGPNLPSGTVGGFETGAVCHREEGSQHGEEKGERHPPALFLLLLLLHILVIYCLIYLS